MLPIGCSAEISRVNKKDCLTLLSFAIFLYAILFFYALYKIRVNKMRKGDGIMPEFEVLTFLSTALGIPSALIGIYGELPGWIEKIRYHHNIDHMHTELSHQFYKVQDRAKRRLSEHIESLSPLESKKYKDQYDNIQREVALRYFIDRPSLIYMRPEEIGNLIKEVEALQMQYRNSDEVIYLVNHYTGFFFEELSNYDLLSKWYSCMTIRQVNEKCDDILKRLNETGKKMNQVWNSVRENNRTLRKVNMFINNFITYLGLSIIGTGVSFLLLLVLGSKLDTLCLTGIPICLLLSDIIVSVFKMNESFVFETWISSMYRDSSIIVKILHGIKKLFQFFYFSISAFWQTIIASTSLFIILKVYAGEFENFFHLIIAISFGCFTIQYFHTHPTFIHINE